MPENQNSPHESAGPSRTQKIIAAVVWGLVLTTYVVVTQRTGLGPIDTARTMIRVLSESPWGPVAFIVAYALRPFVFFSAGLLSVLGGILFGAWWGIVFTIVGSNLGASLAYLVGRFFMAGARLPEAVRGWSERMRAFSFETVFVLRLMYVPYDLVNYSAGLLRVRFVPFIAATALGSLPGTVSFTLFGASTEGLDQGLPSFDPMLVLASAGLFVVSLVVARVLRRTRGAGD